MERNMAHGCYIFYRMSLGPRAEDHFNQRPHHCDTYMYVSVPGDSLSVIPIE
jgi:hypothetical protein